MTRILVLDKFIDDLLDAECIDYEIDACGRYIINDKNLEHVENLLLEQEIDYEII